jgi:NADH-quinone oxidoreductase subunit D
LSSDESIERTLRETTAGLTQYSPEGLVPFGPVHPALKEPEYFKIILEGEKIVQIIPRIGYAHRGIERAAQDRTWVQAIYLVERICGICSFSHSLAFVQTVESLTEYEVPRRARYIRLIIAEMERIHSHLLWLGLVGYWTGFDTLFMWVWRDRERVLDLIEMITGNRVHKSYATITGVRRDLPENIERHVQSAMKYLSERVAFYKEIVNTEATILTRTKGVGWISPDVAIRLCPVGPLLRCMGFKRDVRVDDPYAAYDEIVPEVKTSTDSDALSLINLRLEEIEDSIRMILDAITAIPTGPVKTTVPRVIPKGDAMGHVEAPRGELFYFVRSEGGSKPTRVKIRTPTLANILTATEMLKGHTLADVPVVLTAMDPCFGCMDRLTVIDLDEGKEWQINGEQLRRYGIEWYKNNKRE